MSEECGKYLDYFEFEAFLKARNIKLIKTNEINSLTAPADVPPHLLTQKPGAQGSQGVPKSDSAPREEKKRLIPRQTMKMNDAELEEALNDLLKPYPRVDRVWSDPTYNNQNFFLFSFVPSAKAIPDEKGMFGVFKVRGVFSTQNEMNTRAETIIRDIDSYHTIYHSIMGRAHPITPDPEKFVRENTEVDIKSMTGSLINEAVKQARDKEQKEIQEGNQRQKDYLTGDRKEVVDNAEIDEYTEKKVKRANLIFAILDLKTNIRKFKKSLRETVKSLSELNRKNPAYERDYMARYRKASEEAGIPETDNTIIKYMTGEVPFDIQDTEEERLMAIAQEKAEEEHKAKNAGRSAEDLEAERKKKSISYFDSDVYGARTAQENKYLHEEREKMALLNKNNEDKGESSKEKLEDGGLSRPPAALQPIKEE